ncbi:MAG: hypothetical protein JRN23_01025 [Nitrososphaerota archaeon]|nr:hypothetical protein [Nitrososphaerota archaeon]
MRAIIHSIHSQVPETVASLPGALDTIVSMDSHLDVSLGGDDSVYPEELRPIVARTAAHSALRRLTGGLTAFEGREPCEEGPEVVAVVPEAMLARHAADVESKLPSWLRVKDEVESVSSTVRFLAETMGIDAYTSPPKPLLGLLGRTRGVSWLLDVDVDYMEEMQGECYTRIFDAGPGVLQRMAGVIEFVRRSKPETITISEAKVSAIRDPRSRFSEFVGKLRALGYSVEERGIFPSDAEVVRGIAVCREFYRTVSRRLMRDHMDEMMRGDTGSFQRAEAAAAREFFRRKGYG